MIKVTGYDRDGLTFDSKVFEGRRTGMGDHFRVGALRAVHQKAHLPAFRLASRVLCPARTEYGEAVQLYGAVWIVRCSHISVEQNTQQFLRSRWTLTRQQSSSILLLIDCMFASSMLGIGGRVGWFHNLTSSPPRLPLFRLYCLQQPVRHISDCLIMSTGIADVVDNFGAFCLMSYKVWRSYVIREDALMVSYWGALFVDS